MAVKKRAGSLRRAFNARGVFVFVMTPFRRTKDRQGRYEVDLPGVERNIRHFSRVDGEKVMVVCGGSGEFHSLSPAEVASVAQAAVAGAEGRCRVVCGIGGPTKNAVRMAGAAQAAGCDAVLVMPHEGTVKRGEKALYEHHRAISKAISIGLMPFRASDQLLSLDLVKRLSAFKNTVAIKEESGAVDWVRTGARVTGGMPFITGGSENMIPYYYLAGAVGFTTGMANLTLPQSVQLHNAAIAKDWDRAMAWRDYFEPLTDARRELGTPMLKGGLEMMGLAGGPVRATGAVLDAAGRRRVRKLMKEKGLL
ncbi:MAG: dihydrodipicolinate synthase family protein [Candidatus Latescibacteria bacterium]|nr:dihydrodipicolinate synthase family protein [Candidatus Latescibacterota bacterium]